MERFGHFHLGRVAQTPCLDQTSERNKVTLFISIWRTGEDMTSKLISDASQETPEPKTSFFRNWRPICFWFLTSLFLRMLCYRTRYDFNILFGLWRVSRVLNISYLEARHLKSIEKYMDDPDMQKVKDVSEDAARSTKKNWHFF